MSVKLLKLALAAILLSGCGCGPKEYDHKLFPYVHEFLQDCRGRLATKPGRIKTLHVIKYQNTATDEEPDKVAECLIWKSLGTVWRTEVRISRGTEMRERSLVYHELGHCLLDEPHNEDGVKIMNAYVTSDQYLKEHWDDMVDDLCHI